MNHNQRNRRVRFFFNNQSIEAVKGQSVAAALMANEQYVLRQSSRRNEPRGLFCGMGICFECLMCIDGKPNQRACQIPVSEGMQVEVQQGNGKKGSEL